MKGLLLLISLLFLAAHLQVELAWFHQFDLQIVLLQRWSMQLASGAVGLVFVGLGTVWWRALASVETVERRTWISGWRYGMALAVASCMRVGGATVLGLLFWQVLAEPSRISDWWLTSGRGVRWMLLLGINSAMLLESRLRRGSQLLVALAFVFVVGRCWGIWALALAIPSAGLQDPVLHTDLSFGLGQFAAAELAVLLLLSGSIFCLGSALLRLLTRGRCLSDWSSPEPSLRTRRGLAVMAATCIAVGAAGLWLSRHSLLWEQHGIVAGVGWLQATVTIPSRAWLSLVVTVLAVACLFPRRVRLQRLLMLVIAASITLQLLLTPLMRWLLLRPQELSLQTSYIEHSIASTRRAFQLDRMVRSAFEPNPQLTPEDLTIGASTLRNLRLWDSAPLLESNRQLQQLRVYYSFPQASVDRYPLQPSRNTSQQVILSARELDQSALPKRSRTWLNRHFVFTHGYGFTVSPVNSRGDDNLPDYFISDLGTKTRIQGNAELEIEREDVEAAIPVRNAALYFGTLPAPYAVVPTAVDEFDYPEGDLNVYTHYSGRAGIGIGGAIERLCAALVLREPRLLTTRSIQPDSRVIIRRDVRERVKHIAPFLDLRGDPYLVSVPTTSDLISTSSEQHQFWIVEGYTHSSTYPYSAAISKTDSDRYLRNSVKAVVDAFNGSVQLYIREPNDPIIQGWQRLFPQLFQPLSEMPEPLRDHLRVPEELFDIQVKQLQRYHVEDPRVFYSGDDVWQVPLEVYDGEQISVRPYHITAQVQKRSSSEFLLLQPLTPLARPNLTAWLAARNDGEHYGELLQMDFPKDTPILGPEQVQALINQEPEISRLFGLWDRAGSQVVQGNLLVVPVGQSLLYVEPVYLRARKGGLPALTRIVVSDGQAIAMAESLPDAIDQLIKKTLPST